MQQKLFQKQQFKKKSEATGDLIGKEIANKITSVSENLQEKTQKNHIQMTK